MPTVRIPVKLTNLNLPSPAFNVWHGRYEFEGDLANPGVGQDGLLDHLHDFYTAVTGLLAQGTTVEFPTLMVDPNTQEEVSAPAYANIVSTSTAAGPAGLAMTVAWKTSLRGRRGMGRTFLGPINPGLVQTDGKLSTGAAAIAQAAADALVTASLGAGGWALGVYGQENKGVAEPKILRDFTRASLSRVPAHLRSRRD